MKTKYKIYTALIAALCTVLLALTGCSDFNPSLQGGGDGKLILSINASTSRTIQPGNIEFSGYEAEFLDEDDEVIPGLSQFFPHDASGVYNILDIPVGEYKLRITAFMGLEYLPVAQGETDSTFEIEEEKDTEVTINLSPIATAEGTFEWSVNLEGEELEMVYFFIYEGDDAQVDIYNAFGDYTLVEDPDPIHSFQKNFNDTISLPTGRYTVIFTFLKDDDNWFQVPQLLDIYPGLTSSFHYSLDPDFFTKPLEEFIIVAIETNDFSSIMEGHFGVLDIQIGSNYTALKTKMNDLYMNTQGAVLEDLDDLILLVDVALLSLGVKEEYDSEDEAVEAITELLLNGSEWNDFEEGDDGLVTLIFGAYSVSFKVKAGECCTGLNEVCLHEAGKAIVKNPLLSTNEGQGGAQGSWSGTYVTPNAVTDWSGGAVRYAFPADTVEFKIADYDFIALEYESAATGQVILKQLTTGTDYGFVSNQYPTLTANGSLNLQIRGAGTSGGVALQRNSGTISFKLNRVVFTPGVRRDFTFDLGGYEETAYAGPDSAIGSSSIKVVETMVFGNLPSPTWSTEYIFSGWKLNDTVVTSNTVLTSELTGSVLVAQWTYMPPVSVSPITVDTTGKVFAKVSTPVFTIDAGGNGYTIESGLNYDWSLVSFKVTLPQGVSLANYDTISFAFTPLGGDLNNKTFVVLNATGTVSGGNNFADYVITPSSDSTGGTATARSFMLSIDKAKTSSLTGEIELAIWSGMGSSATYTISDIKLLPPPVLWLSIDSGNYVTGPIWSWIATDQTHSMKGRFTKSISDQIKAIPGAELWVYWTGNGGYGRIESNISLNASGGSGIQKVPISSISFPSTNDGVFDFNIWSASGGIDKMEVYYPAGASVTPPVLQ